MEFDSFDKRKYPTLSAQDGYKEWAATYEKIVLDLMDIRLLSKIDFIDWQSITKAIDLACGTGRIGVWLNSKGVKVIEGIDFTNEMIEFAKQKQVYQEIHYGDILKTDLASDTYDLATEVLADEHIENLEPLYQEAARIVKNAGYFIIVGYHPFFLMNGIPTHFDRSSGESVAIKSYIHLFSDHIKAAYKSNWSLVYLDEGIIDEDWIRDKAKWQKYLNQPVSFIFVWQKI